MKQLRVSLIAVGVLGIASGLSAVLLSSGTVSLFFGVVALFVALPETPAPQQSERSYTIMPADEPINDQRTGLFNEKYFQATIDTRVLAAKRHLRPVSVALLAVSQGQDRTVRADMVKVSEAIRSTLRDSDIACHLDDGRFAFILEDTPEDGAVWTLERLRRSLAEIDSNMVQWAGIACYPAHAFNSQELMSKAQEALDVAWEWPQARIEVAHAS
jgi:diguanylate cyclase (GGDEF)-like protein